MHFSEAKRPANCADAEYANISRSCPFTLEIRNDIQISKAASPQQMSSRIELFSMMEWTNIFEKDRQERHSKACGEKGQAEDREARPGDEGRHRA